MNYLERGVSSDYMDGSFIGTNDNLEKSAVVARTGITQVFCFR